MDLELIHKLAYEVSIKMGFDDTQAFIINRLKKLFATYPMLAEILAANPELNIEEAIEAAEQCTQSTKPSKELTQGKSENNTLLLLLLLLLIREMRKGEQKRVCSFIRGKKQSTVSFPKKAKKEIPSTINTPLNK